MKSVFAKITILLMIMLVVSVPGRADVKIVSHPPLHPLANPAGRPMEKGPGYFVDALRGNDSNPGTEQSPWKTVNHAMPLLKAGDTLYLREGVFHENVYCSVVGKEDAPITIRSYPGELVVVDGGIPEFLDAPDKAWVPFAEGAPGEYRSARRYRNIRDVVGLFGDSNIGLVTYWHAMDLRATNERWMDDPAKKLMVLPVYCGPGIWYDKETGYIHARLAHTTIQKPFLSKPQVADYEGETDARKVPLVVTPFNSTPLFVDQAMHVRFHDLVIRGGGYNAVVLHFGIDLEFDNVTIFAGTYGIRASSTGPLRFVNSAIYGMMQPWAWRNENELRTFTPRLSDPFITSITNTDPTAPGAARGNTGLTNLRNIARMTTHALLVTEGFEESTVFAYPFNHDWEMAYNEFADGHDGIYFNGNNMRFHHNWVDNMQDDAIYLSSPTPYVCGDLYFYQNLITRCVTAFACHARGGPNGSIYIMRNIVDMRLGTRFGRPGTVSPNGKIEGRNVFFMHGAGKLLGVESIYFYQNTFLANVGPRTFADRTLWYNLPKASRRVFNNMFIYLGQYPDTYLETNPGGDDIQIDGNLHWCPNPDVAAPANYLESVRKCALSQQNKTKYPPGWETNSRVADPKFVSFSAEAKARNDYRLQQDSPAIGSGIILPSELDDPLRPKSGANPDIGAMPFGGDPLKVGIHGRVTAGIPGRIEE
jgi:hypothetical protein